MADNNNLAFSCIVGSTGLNGFLFRLVLFDFRLLPVSINVTTRQLKSVMSVVWCINGVIGKNGFWWSLWSASAIESVQK
jgi:hypothetical protein